MKAWLGWTLAATVALIVLQGVAGGLFMPATPPIPGFLPWWLASDLPTAAVAAGLARSARADRARRIVLLLVVLFVIPADNLAETVLFDIGLPPGLLPRLYLFNLAVATGMAALLGWPGRPDDGPSRPATRSARAWTGRIAVGVIAYEVAYFTAGTAVFPFVADFYAARHLPAAPSIALVQVFRGLGFLAVAWAIARWTEGGARPVALRVGLTLSIFGGVAPLMMPNPYMPAHVRLAHLVEVGVSNLLFGLLAGWLMARPAPPAEHERGRFAA